jgi:imidazolonepropionase-like amidohydrolase
MSADGKRTIVISDGTLIDGNGNPPVRNEAIVIQGNRIKSTGRLPDDVKFEDRDTVEVIDATGQWIMPGLIDAHTHLSYGNPKLPGEARGRGTTRPEFNTLRAARNAQQVLLSGVTSISVPGGTWFTDVAVRDAIKLGLIEGPRVYCASRMIVTYGSIEDEEPSWVGTPDHSIGMLCNSAAEMVTEARRQCKHGVDFIKLADSRSGEIQTLAQEEIAAVVAEAHRRNVKVAIHSRGSASTRAAAEAGVDWIMHTDMATEVDLEVVAKAGVRIVPTATFVERVLEVGREIGQEQIQISLERMKKEHGGVSERFAAGADYGHQSHVWDGLRQLLLDALWQDARQRARDFGSPWRLHTARSDQRLHEGKCLCRRIGKSGGRARSWQARGRDHFKEKPSG